MELILSFASTGIIVRNHHILFGFVCFVASLGSWEGLPIQPLILAHLALGFCFVFL